MPDFLGLDLAWHRSGAGSALVRLRGSPEDVSVRNVAFNLQSDDDIIAAVDYCAGPDAVLAIDAPIIVNNVSGKRPCESTLTRLYGHAHAGPHSSNLSLFPIPRGAMLAQHFVAHGWRHATDPAQVHRAGGRWIIEVFPHPAHVTLFDLPRIIKYKKGTLALRRTGLVTLRESILRHLAAASPALVIPPPNDEYFVQLLGGQSGSYLKSYEDMLDAVLCAYVGAHYWAWGGERNSVVGDLESGYIVVPTHTAWGSPWSYRRRRLSSADPLVEG